MPSFEWLKIQDGETKGNPPKNSRNSPIIFGLFHKKKRMRDICMLVNARNILEWPVLSVNFTAAKLQTGVLSYFPANGYPEYFFPA